MSVVDVIGHGLRDSFLMAWEVWWALVLGFAISAIVQAWVPRERIERLMSGSDASAVSALAFQFASTNLVWELGLVLWVLIGWQFTVAEYVGGLVMIVRAPFSNSDLAIATAA
jgi:uncharacterized membrane protein YraQ (UPF0718 family)